MVSRLGLGLAVLAALVLLVPRVARGQSAADLSPRLVVDAQIDEWTSLEAAFRGDEERGDDSAGSAVQELRQIRVTWDAHNLYIAVEATLGGQALVLGLDFEPGGLESMSGLETWRRSLRFGSEIEPDLFLAVHDAQVAAELWQVTGRSSAARISTDAYASAASFVASTGGGLEAAIPWSVLFPDATRGIDPEPGAPADSMFVLPIRASAHGLRVAAILVDAADGRGAFDLAPDGTTPIPTDPGAEVVVDRAVRIDWDARSGPPPDFVDFGAAVQTQTAPRFVPNAPATGTAVQIDNLRTFANGSPSRLLLADSGLDLDFAFDVHGAVAPLYVTASIYSLRGERVRLLYQDLARSPAVQPPPFGAYGDPARDHWDGRDAGGRSAPGGIYVLRLGAGPTPGAETTAIERAVTVVR